ncbi:sigma 54-interacting transcriptional regulator [Myxococcota bacterium]|nr:sigma 54-interacting transcriptional regulator [Myxococcota bacterium]
MAPPPTSPLPALRALAEPLTSTLDLDEVLGPLLRALSERFDLRRVALCLVQREEEGAGETLCIEAAHGLTPAEVRRGRYAMGEGIVGRVAASGEAQVVPRISEDPRFLDRTGALDEGVERAFLCVPVRVGGQVLGTLSAYREPAPAAVLAPLVDLLVVVAAMLGPAVAERASRRGRPAGGAGGAEAPRPTAMIGTSRAMQRVYELVAQVAPSNTTVLLRGESGTGKELVADALHQGSNRAQGPLVKVNLAALPDSLIESELFGHERGAFTGALQARKGRFELAQGGTIFLDEVGDLSPPTQIKLLRVLQQRTLERLGSNRTIDVDVRIVAATSRDLEAMIDAGTFRKDLYYRLNVFPIHLPPLRERKADILLLADHFVLSFNRLHGRQVKRISTPAIDMLTAYHWPGNVRELENCIERAVLLTRDDVIHGHHLPPSLQTAEASGTGPTGGLQAQLDAVEREMLLDALKSTGGNMAAAARMLEVTERVMGLRVVRHGIEPARFKRRQ